MISFINTFTKNAEEVGLIINISKTKHMVTNKDNPPFNITVYGKPIQQVTESVYLSSSNVG